MTGHAWPLARWHESLANAIRDRALDAVPVILVQMARDGWGHEAEQARRLMVTAAATPRPTRRECPTCEGTGELAAT